MKVSNKINALINGLNRMSKQLGEIKKRMFILKRDLDNLWNPNEVTKKQIRDLLDKKPNLDQGDIADNLNLDLELVCQLCDELLAEGKIKTSNDKRKIKKGG